MATIAGAIIQAAGFRPGASGILFQTDNAADIGATAANRPRDLHLGRNAAIAGTLVVTGATAVQALTATTLGITDAFSATLSTNSDYAHTITNANAGTAAEANLYVRNAAANSAAVQIGVGGTGFTTAGGYIQDAGWVATGTALAGGLSIIARAGDVRVYAGGHTNLIGTWSTTGLAMNSLAVSGVTTLATALGVTWDFGAAAVVSPTSPNRTLRVKVAGTDYYIAAKTTND